MIFSTGKFSLQGIGLAGIVGVQFNLILPRQQGTKENLE